MAKNESSPGTDGLRYDEEFLYDTPGPEDDDEVIDRYIEANRAAFRDAWAAYLKGWLD